MHLIARLMVFSSILTASGCALFSSVDRPDTNLCIINVELLQKNCHNLSTDYDSNGHLIKGVAAKIIKYQSEHEMLIDLDKNMCTDPLGLANLKAYIKNLRRAAGE